MDGSLYGGALQPQAQDPSGPRRDDVSDVIPPPNHNARRVNRRGERERPNGILHRILFGPGCLALRTSATLHTSQPRLDTTLSPLSLQKLID
jgi:hypothetical protein